jgi:hypothetical protein
MMLARTLRDEAPERGAPLWPAPPSLLALMLILAAVALAAASMCWRRRSTGQLLKKADSSGRLYPRARAGTVREPSRQPPLWRMPGAAAIGHPPMCMRCPRQYA